MKRVGVIGIPGKWSSERLAESLQKKTGFRLLVSMDEINLDINARAARCRGEKLNELDAIIIKKIGPSYSHHMLDRLEMLHFLNNNSVKIFSDPLRIKNAVDRLTCTLELARGDIPVPETVITENVEKALETVETFGKAVFKPLFTSKARGMKVIQRGPDALSAIEAFKDDDNPVMYIQKMVDIPGKDLGLAFLGGDYIATYARVGKNDSWNTTTHFGGRYEPHTPSQEIIDLAAKAQSLFNLDFTCVDVAETPDGPIVFEVSAFGGFRGLLEANNIDAAELYANYVLEKTEDA